MWTPIIIITIILFAAPTNYYHKGTRLPSRKQHMMTARITEIIRMMTSGRININRKSYPKSLAEESYTGATYVDWSNPSPLYAGLVSLLTAVDVWPLSIYNVSRGFSLIIINQWSSLGNTDALAQRCRQSLCLAKWNVDEVNHSTMLMNAAAPTPPRPWRLKIRIQQVTS